jgi:hypothetical protein
VFYEDCGKHLAALCVANLAIKSGLCRAHGE